MRFHILALILGFLLDLAFGDPRWLYHPIRLIGNLTAWAEKPFRAVFPKSEKGELTAGVFFAVFVVAVSGGKAFHLAGFRAGGVLELSDPGGEIAEDREYESL